MADDIVTRLRIESASSVDVIRRLDMECLCCPCCEESCLYCETIGELTEAADEIERLRTERDRWRELADSLARFGNCESPDCPDCDRDWKLTYESYEQAVRGE